MSLQKKLDKRQKEREKMTDQYDKALHDSVRAEMDNYRANPSNGNRYFYGVMALIDVKCMEARNSERAELLNEFNPMSCLPAFTKKKLTEKECYELIGRVLSEKYKKLAEPEDLGQIDTSVGKQLK